MNCPPAKGVHRVLLAVIFLNFLLSAQVTTGSVSGYVLDPSGKTIPHAVVTIQSETQTLKRTTTSENTGFYEFDALAPRDYLLNIDAPGFAPLKMDAVRVQVDQRVHLDIQTRLVRRQEKVEVNVQTSALSPDSSEIGEVLTQSLIDGLPLNERDFLQLAFLLPGVTPPVNGSQLSTRGTFAMHANGGREEDNDFLLDGVDNDDSDTRGYVLQPSVDSIQEFKIATTTYNAEYGTASAGQVNIITRSGGNDFHGTAYDYLRNRVLDARNFFDGAQKPQYIRNQFGAYVWQDFFSKAAAANTVRAASQLLVWCVAI